MKLAAVVAAWFVALFASIAIGQSITPGRGLRWFKSFRGRITTHRNHTLPVKAR